MATFAQVRRQAWTAPALAVAVILGCTGCRRDAPATQSASSTDFVVAVLGDHTAKNLAQQLRAASVSIVTDLEDEGRAAHVVIAQDASTGAMPVHREIIEKVASQKDRELLWVFTNTNLIEDPELLELEELEARELLNSFGLPGDTAQFAFDSEEAPVALSYECPKGRKAIVEYVVGWQ